MSNSTLKFIILISAIILFLVSNNETIERMRHLLYSNILLVILIIIGVLAVIKWKK